MISDEEWSALCSQVKRWEKLARDQDEQTPAGDGGQRMAVRRCADGCNGCDDCTDYDDPPECPRCHGDGMDPWNDYLMECHRCAGVSP